MFGAVLLGCADKIHGQSHDPVADAAISTELGVEPEDAPIQPVDTAVADIPDATDPVEVLDAADGPDAQDLLDIPPDAPADAELPPDALVDTPISDPDALVPEPDVESSDAPDTADTSEPVAYPAHTSIFGLPSANGAIAIGFRAGPDAPFALDRFYEHPYRAYDEGQLTRELLYDSYFGFRTSSAHGWLNTVSPSEVGYEPGTGIIRVVQESGGLRFESRYFAPWSHGERSVVALLAIENVSNAPIDGVACHVLWNMHLGGEGVNDGENASLIAPAGGPKRILEQRGATRVLYESLVTENLFVTAGAAGAPSNPYPLVAAGEGFGDVVPEAATSDMVIGFENRIGTLAPGQSARCGSVARLDRDSTSPPLSFSAEGWLADERAHWADFHSVEAAPPGADPDQLAVFRQSTAVLAMAQVTALDACPSARCAGQILASLPPGQWHITWVRDQIYATLALLRSGHLAEAKVAMEFLVGSEVRMDGGQPYYQSRFLESTDATPGVWGLGLTLASTVRLSLARYFGRGLEESDANAAGPNIEFDNLGLFLWGFAETVAALPDGAAFRHAHWGFAAAGVADVLVELIDPETGLLVPDSSIWERHFCPHGACAEPETRKRHAYSAIHAAHGLARMAALATAEGDPTRASTYTAAAETLSTAIRTVLRVSLPGTTDVVIAGNVEELPFSVYYLDTAAVDAINLGIVAPDSVEASGTLNAFDAWLRIGAHSPGYRRNDDPTWYDRQEWLFSDLRIASAFARTGQKGRAKTLLDWATQVASMNHGLIPELLSDGVYEAGTEDDLPKSDPGQDPGGDAQGAIPMVGFGAGVYILALFDLMTL